MSRNLFRASAVLFLLGLAAACSWLPLPYTLDLRARLGGDTSGVAHHRIEAGDSGDLNISHPEDSDQDRCIDFQDVDLPVTVQSARLHYSVSADYEGPALEGRVTAQLYLSSEPGRRWLPSNKVGPQVTVNLRNPDTRLAGTAVLNREQVEGINAKHLCWGVRLTGDDVTALSSGDATVEYEIHELKLAIRFSVI